MSTLTAFGLAAEMDGRQRLTRRSIGAHLELLPTTHSSGTSRPQGSITKTGLAMLDSCSPSLRGISDPDTAPKWTLGVASTELVERR